MKLSKQAGFTIIEITLFLAISGLLIMSVLAGTGTAINSQRYRDSITSLQSYLQQQYSNVANVSNDNMNNACDGNNKVRGQSDCVILGKFITSSNGTNLNVKDVLGTSCPTDATSDLVALQGCGIITSPVNSETYDIEWGASVAKPGGGNLVLSMLILRSPLSGIIRTFISGSQKIILDRGISVILSEENPSSLQNSAKICVNSNGLFTGPMMAVQVNADTTSASGVETLGDNSGC